MRDDILSDLNARVQKSVAGLITELATVRAGRATPSLLDNIIVDYHGTSIPIGQIASISIPEASLIIIQPWDRTSLRDIERAILTSDIGLNPSNDGNTIRVAIPPLSEERRKELAKLISKRVEERRIALRNIRRDSIEKLRQLEKIKDISQDELKITTNKIDQLMEVYINNVGEIGLNKINEIQEV